MAAMDLQCRLEHGEGRWGREEAELLERFDAERKEWESQLKDMQKNIEELYNEVKARREGNSTGSESKMPDCFPPISEKSAPPGHPCNGYFHPPNHHSNGISSHLDRQSSTGTIALLGSCSSDDYNPDGHRSNGYSYPNHHSNGCGRPAGRDGHVGRDSAEEELEEILHSCLGQALPYIPSCAQNGSIQATNTPQSVEHEGYNDGRQKYRNAVNSALRDIARVSEDLCSYQDAIRKKSSDKRNEADSVRFEEVENDKQPEWGDQQGNSFWETASRSSNKADMGVKPSLWKPEAPPIPPRNSSWSVNSSNSPEPQIPVQESFANRKCHSPCSLADRKCTSPSVLRKFEAMLQENEGKILTDSGVLSSTAPADSKCNASSFHSRVWNTKSSAFVPVRKRSPEAGMLGAETDCRADSKPADGQKFPTSHFQPTDRESVGKSVPADFRSPPKGQWRSPAVGRKGVGQGLDGENMTPSEMGVRAKDIHLYSQVQPVEIDEEVRSLGSRFQAVRPLAPVSHTQSPDFWYSCREEEPRLRGYGCPERFQQGHNWGQNGSGQHEDLIELLGMLGIQHQYDTAKTYPPVPCPLEIPQESQKSSRPVKKSFSRPARPANRRPPSRWAGRVPSAPAAPATPFPDPAHKQTLSPYSHQIETVIM